MVAAAPGERAYAALAQTQARQVTGLGEPTVAVGLSDVSTRGGVPLIDADSLDLGRGIGSQDPSQIDVPSTDERGSVARAADDRGQPAGPRERDVVEREQSTSDSTPDLTSNVSNRTDDSSKGSKGFSGKGRTENDPEKDAEQSPPVLGPLTQYESRISAPDAPADRQEQEVDHLYTGGARRRSSPAKIVLAASAVGAIVLAGPRFSRADEQENKNEAHAQTKEPPREPQPAGHAFGADFLLAAGMIATGAVLALRQVAKRGLGALPSLPRAKILPALGDLLVMIAGSAILGASYSYVISSLGSGPNLNAMSGLLAFFSLKFLLRRKGHTADHNNLVQSPMTMASGANWMVVGMIAMAMQGLELPAWLWATMLIIANYLGILLALPFRSHFITDKNTGFPMGVANAKGQMILVNPSGSGSKSVWALAIAGAFTALYVFVKEVLGLIPKVFFATKHSLGMGSSLLTFAVGTLIPARMTIWGGIAAVLTWGVAAPLLMGKALGFEINWLPESMAHLANGSSYSILLMNVTMWVGTAFLLAQNLTSLVLNWISLARSPRGRTAGPMDPADPNKVSLKRVLPAVLLLTGLLGLALFLGAGVSLWVTALAVLASIPLMLVGVRIQAEVGLTPISTLAFVTLMLSSLLPGVGLMEIMIASIITAAMVTASSVMMNDLKTAHLIGTNPGSAVLRHLLIGVPVGVLTMVLVYPILSAKGFGENGLPAPVSRTWQGLALLLNMGLGTLPPALWIAIGVAALAGIALAFFERRWTPSTVPWWVPSATGIGLALLLPGHVMLLMALGGIVALLLKRYRPKEEKDTYQLPVATGIIAAEAVGTLIVTLLRNWGII